MCVCVCGGGGGGEGGGGWVRGRGTDRICMVRDSHSNMVPSDTNETILQLYSFSLTIHLHSDCSRAHVPSRCGRYTSVHPTINLLDREKHVLKFKFTLAYYIYM